MKRKIDSVIVCIIILALFIPTISATERNLNQKDTLSSLSTFASSSNNSSGLSLNFINATGKGNITTFGGSSQDSLIDRCYAMIIEFEDDGYTEIRTFDPLNPFKNLKNILNREPSVIEGKHDMLIIGFFGKINETESNISIKGVALAFWTISK